MLDNKTALELTGIAHAGGSLEVDAVRYTALELTGVAHALKPGAHLKIHNSNSKTALELTGICPLNRAKLFWRRKTSPRPALHWSTSAVEIGRRT